MSYNTIILYVNFVGRRRCCLRPTTRTTVRHRRRPPPPLPLQCAIRPAATTVALARASPTSTRTAEVHLISSGVTPLSNTLTIFSVYPVLRRSAPLRSCVRGQQPSACHQRGPWGCSARSLPLAGWCRRRAAEAVVAGAR